jgi:hypothetical protein
VDGLSVGRCCCCGKSQKKSNQEYWKASSGRHHGQEWHGSASNNEYMGERTKYKSYSVQVVVVVKYDKHHSFLLLVMTSQGFIRSTIVLFFFSSPLSRIRRHGPKTGTNRSVSSQMLN